MYSKKYEDHAWSSAYAVYPSPPSKDHVAVTGGNVPISYLFPLPTWQEQETLICLQSMLFIKDANTAEIQKCLVATSQLKLCSKLVIKSSAWSWFRLYG